jgi:O-antigen ligase
MVALIISFSRGALFGLILAGGGILTMRSWRAAGAYAAVALALAIVAVPVIVSARLAGGGTFEILMENDQGRFNAWLAGIRMILAEPILGHGFYSFRVLGEGYGATDGLQTAHNDLVGLWAESGIVAAIAYVVTAFGIVACAMKRRTDPWAVASVGALTVFLVASSFNIQSMFLEVVGPLWLVVAYGIARPLDAARGRPSPTRQAAMGAAGHAINREYTEAAH